jgi:hypothetical protein
MKETLIRKDENVRRQWDRRSFFVVCLALQRAPAIFERGHGSCCVIRARLMLCISPVMKETLIRKDENGRSCLERRINNLRGHFERGHGFSRAARRPFIRALAPAATGLFDACLLFNFPP